MKRVLNYITSVLFFSFIIMFAISTIFVQKKADYYQIKDADISAHKKAENYITSNFPLQKNWKSLYSRMVISTGQSQINDVCVLDNKMIEIFDSVDNKKIEQSIESINEFCGENQKKSVYAMLVPTASGIYSADLPLSSSAVDQEKLIDDIYYKLDKKIVTLDAYNPLFSARDDYIYFRTDNRWTAFGAYYTYAGVINKMGFKAIDLSNYDVEYVDRNFLGNLYDKTYYGGVAADSINLFKNKKGSYVKETISYSGQQKFTSNSVYNHAGLKSDDKYNIFLNGDYYKKSSIFTSSSNDENLLIIKSNYANCFVPFLTPHYKQITLVDLNQLDEGERLEDVVNVSNYDDILFLYDVESFNKCGKFNLINSQEKP